MTSRLAALALSIIAPLVAQAMESRLVDSEGRPIAGARISIVDQSSTARTGADGRFVLRPTPRLPATLLIVGSRDELFPPVYLERASPEIRIEERFSDNVTVTVGTAPNTDGSPASSPALIATGELEQRKPSHVAEAIALIPGVSVRGEGPPAVPVLRGLAGGRTLLLLDDARIVAERRAGPSATFLNPLLLGSIEVSRGPGSVAYGSDAIGGVVHLRLRDAVAGEEGYRYDAWTEVGGITATGIAAEVSSDAFGGALLVSLHARTASDGEDAEGRPIDNSRYRDRGATLRFVRDAEWGRLRLGAFTSVARDVGAPSSDPVLTIYPDERASLVTLGLDFQPERIWSAASVRASAGWSSITTNRLRSSGIESSTVHARDASFRVSGERSTPRSRLVTGVDFVSRFDLHSPGSLEDADRYDGAVFASHEWHATRYQVVTGARLDAIASRNRGGHFGNRSRDDLAASGHLAVISAPVRHVSGTLQVASGYREPTLSDRYFRGVSGRGLVTGNPDLSPERSLQFDGSLRWSSRRSRVALSLYDYRIRRLVERFRVGNDFIFRNRGEAEIRGAELELATRLARTVEFHLGGSVARGQDAGTRAPLDDIGGPSLHTSIRWTGRAASAFVTASAHARDTRPGPLETERPGYTTIDAGTSWRIAPGFEVRMIVRNLANSSHAGSTDALAAMAPGRSVLIGMNR
jgi:outer membrane receptor protein involved in Fe transport